MIFAKITYILRAHRKHSIWCFDFGIEYVSTAEENNLVEDYKLVQNSYVKFNIDFHVVCLFFKQILLE